MKKVSNLAASAVLLVAGTGAFAAHHDGSGNKAVAEKWLAASCGELDGFIDFIEANMADDGAYIPPRYVGLGFQMDSEDTDAFGTVTRVTAGTPASEVLKAGDQITSVAGVAATFENRDRMSFRGAPGEAVEAVVSRDGKEMTVEIERGVIAVTNGKDTVLANLGVANADNWPTDSCSVAEIVEADNIVYMTSEFTDTEDDTGYEYIGRIVTRMKFNDEGKITEAWDMREDQFVLEQLGYTISR